MAAQVGFRKIANDVIDGPSLVERHKAEGTVTNMKPGRLVKRGTTDYDVQVADASANYPAIGWLGYEKANANFKPETIDTAYAAGDEVPVHNGGGFRVRARLASGQNLVKGIRLKEAANGEVTAATIGTDHVVAIMAESVNASGGAKDAWVISLI
ncbi:MAG: hypothetical protein ACXQTR_02575 [Candidatus Methanospirareceae archaeon]